VSAEPASAASPRAYAAVIAGVFLVAAVLLASWLLKSSERLVGTNSVTPESFIFIAKKGQTMCVRDLYVPARADRVRLALAPSNNATPPIDLSLKTNAGYSARVTHIVTGPGYNDFSVPRNEKGASGILCARMGGDTTVSGYSQLPADGRPTTFVDHKPQGGRASVWFLDSHKRSLLSLLPSAARRASIFRAGFVGGWTYLVLLLLLPVLWWAGLRQLLRGRS
jgi:hypothetical protein